MQKVAIVGAGIGGLTLAASLQQGGIDVAVSSRRQSSARSAPGSGYSRTH